MANYRPSTITWWKDALRMLRAHFGEQVLRRVEDVTLERLQAYFAAKRASGWTSHTYSSQYRALRAFLSWSVRRELLPVNPLDAIARPRLEKKLPKRISAQEVTVILDYAFYGARTCRFQRYRDRAMLAVMVHAGLRLSETVNLQLEHVDLAGRSLFVHRGKGAKDRLIPMSATLARYLEEYLAQRGAEGRLCPMLFTAARRDLPLAKRGLKRMIQKLKAATGINVSAHRLRHTFATLMLEGGCDLFSLKEMMGHSRIETTMGYLSATLGHLRTQIAKHPLDSAGANFPASSAGACGSSVTAFPFTPRPASPMV